MEPTSPGASRAFAAAASAFAAATSAFAAGGSSFAAGGRARASPAGGGASTFAAGGGASASAVPPPAAAADSGGLAAASGADLPPIRILSIDGGGTKGIIPARIIEYISARAGRPIHELFDFVAGSSVGALLAGTCFCVRDGQPVIPASKLVSQLSDDMWKIFGRFSHSRATFVATHQPYKSPAVIEALLKEYCGDARISQMAAYSLITAFDIEEMAPLCFTTAQALRDPYAHDVLLRDILRASSSAPILFPPVRLHIPGVYAFKDHSTFIDGCFTSNNASLLVHTEATRLFPGRKVLLLNLGTGENDAPMNYNEARHWGAFNWLGPMIECALTGSTMTAAAAMQHLLGNDFLRLSPRIPPGGERMADASPENLKALVRTVENQILTGETVQKLDAFIDRILAATDHPLGVPRPHVSVLPRDFVVVPKPSSMACKPMKALSDMPLYGPATLTFENVGFSVKLSPIMRAVEGIGRYGGAAVNLGGAAVTLGASRGFRPRRKSVEEKEGRKERRHILSDVSGEIRPGTMTIVLGPAMAGKTALLRVLANQSNELRKAGRVQGKVFLDGVPAKKSRVFERRVVLVGQDDGIHYPQLTVEETLRFAACLKGAHGSERDPADIRNAHVRALTASMAVNLVQAKHSRVGDQAVRGISGGEKRRLTVAVELVAGAHAVILLDQPTDGLDASASLDLCRALKDLAASGAAVVCSLLQPSWEVFSTFDQLILLSRGRSVYQGPAGLAPVRHFEAMGYVNPQGLCPPDFLVAIASQVQAQAPSTARSLSLANAPFSAADDDDDVNLPGAEYPVKRKYGKPAGAQFVALYKRFNKLLVRNRQETLTRLIETAAAAFILGTLFCQMAATGAGGLSRLAFLQSVLLVYAFLSLGKVDQNYQSRRVMYRQTEEHMYRAELWVLAYAASELPRLFLETLLFSVISYFAAGLQKNSPHFARYLFVMYLGSATADLVTMFLCLVISRREVCCVLAPLAPAIFFIFGGFLIHRPAIPSWWKWARYLSYFSYTHAALAINEMSDLLLEGLPGVGGALLLDGVGIEMGVEWYWYNVLSILAYYCIVLVLCMLAAVFVRFRRPFPVVPSMPPIPISEGVVLPSPSVRSGAQLAIDDGQKSARLGAQLDDGQKKAVAPLDVEVVRFDQPSPTSADMAKSPTSARASKWHKALDTVSEMQAKYGVPRHTLSQTGGAAQAPQLQPSSALTFTDLCYEVPAQEKDDPPMRLLNNVTGAVRGRSLTAIMGASGSGKTTLLDVLAHRKTTGTVSGSIRLNGSPVTDTFPHISSYVEQFDLLYPTMTIREAVVLSAMIRLDRKTPRSEKQTAAEDALAELDLTPYGDLVIGTLGCGGIPVEMRKRVCIAMELVPQPAILFLDEPTTGLDSTAALRIGQLLRRIANDGQATVATIQCDLSRAAAAGATPPPQPALATALLPVRLPHPSQARRPERLLRRPREPQHASPLLPRLRRVRAAGVPQPGELRDRLRRGARRQSQGQGRRRGVERDADPGAGGGGGAAGALRGEPARGQAQGGCRSPRRRADGVGADRDARAPALRPPGRAAHGAQAALALARARERRHPRLLHPGRWMHHRHRVVPPGDGFDGRDAAPLAHLHHGSLQLLHGDGGHPVALQAPRGLLPRASPGAGVPAGDPRLEPARERAVRRRQRDRLHRHRVLPRRPPDHQREAGVRRAGGDSVEPGVHRLRRARLPPPPQCFDGPLCRLGIPRLWRLLLRLHDLGPRHAAGLHLGALPHLVQVRRPVPVPRANSGRSYPYEALATNELDGVAFDACLPSLASVGGCIADGVSVLDHFDLRAGRRWPNVGIIIGFWIVFEALKYLALRRINHLRR